MLQRPKLSKIQSKAARQLKKYTKSLLRKDRTMRGPKVYTFVLSDGQTVTTAKPNQNGVRAYPWRYALWLKDTISGRVWRAINFLHNR